MVGVVVVVAVWVVGMVVVAVRLPFDFDGVRLHLEEWRSVV